MFKQHVIDLIHMKYASGGEAVCNDAGKIFVSERSE